MRKKTRLIFSALIFILVGMLDITPSSAMSVINRGLMELTPSRYAKVYTLTSGKYYELYSDSDLTKRLPSSYWTGEDDDVWLIETGRTNKGVSYARIKYPVGNSRVEAYAKLQSLFVSGKLDADPRQARSGFHGLYKRKNEGRNFNWWIDPDDDVYLLTKENQWCQVMYPIQGNLWRIAWMPENDYKALFNGSVPGNDEAARNQVVGHAREVLNYEWRTDGYIVLHYSEYEPNTSGGVPSLFSNHRPVVATGTLRGIPYSLSANGNGSEKTYSEYKSLSDSDRKQVSNVYGYGRSGSQYLWRVGMKYGMSCATFVWDCLAQSLTGLTRTAYCPNIPTLWGSYLTSSSLSNLKKGDILWRSTHVMLVAENDTSASKITVIEQAPPYIGSTRNIGSIYLPPHGYYNSDVYDTYTVGTQENTYSYTYLNNNYRGYKVTYPSVPSVIAPEITSFPSGAVAIAGQQYSYQCSANNEPSEWNISEGSIPSFVSSTQKQYCRTTIPPGLFINSSTGRISGTPSSTSAGKSAYYPLYYFFNVDASNSGGEDHRQARIDVYEPPVITTGATLSNATEQKSYNLTIRADGTEFSMRWKKKSGTLPSGMSFSYSSSKRTATISGKPSKGTAGTYKFTIECSNASGRAVTTKEFTLKVIAKVDPVPTDNMWFTKYWGGTKNVASFEDGRVDEQYSSKVCIDWTSTVYFSRLLLENTKVTVEAGSLPNGLSARISGMYVYLEGKPTKEGIYRFKLRVTNGYASKPEYTEHDFVVTIAPSGRSGLWRDSSMSTVWNYLKGKIGVSYSDYVKVKNGTSPYTVEVIEGSLYGMQIRVSGSLIYLEGIPRRSTYSFTLRITGSHNGYVDKKCTVNMAENKAYQKASATIYEKTVKPKFLTSKLTDATVENEWEVQLEANGTQPIVWRCGEKDIPEGFTLSRTGILSGIPSQVKKYRFKVTAENSAGTTSKTFTLNAKAEKPSVTTSVLPYGVLKTPYKIILEADGTAPIKWSKSGKFPSGLKLNSKTGEITGKPKKAGTYKFNIKAKNKAGTDTVATQMVIYAEEPEDDGTITASENSTVFSSVTSVETEHTSAELYAISGDEEFDEEITAKPGMPLNFGILGWTDEYGHEIDSPDVEILINGTPVRGIEISEDGTFVLPSEYVNGVFTVRARLVSDDTELTSGTVTVSTEISSEDISSGDTGEADEVDEADDAKVESEASVGSSGGCDSGFSLAILLSLCVMLISKRR